jgi:hypothetical protein
MKEGGNTKKLWKRIIQSFFAWSLVIPSGKDTAKPFEGKITSSDKEDESWADPLDIADDSILRRTDPILMTKKERHENSIRYWMERKGYSKEEVEKPLTDERMKELGRTTYEKFEEYSKKVENREVNMSKSLISLLKSSIRSGN